MLWKSQHGETVGPSRLRANLFTMVEMSTALPATADERKIKALIAAAGNRCSGTRPVHRAYVRMCAALKQHVFPPFRHLLFRIAHLWTPLAELTDNNICCLTSASRHLGCSYVYATNYGRGVVPSHRSITKMTTV